MIEGECCGYLTTEPDPVVPLAGQLVKLLGVETGQRLSVPAENTHYPHMSIDSVSPVCMDFENSCVY